MNRMTPGKAEVVQSAYARGFSYSEIARFLGIKRSTMTNYYYKWPKIMKTITERETKAVLDLDKQLKFHTKRADTLLAIVEKQITEINNLNEKLKEMK